MKLADVSDIDLSSVSDNFYEHAYITAVSNPVLLFVHTKAC